MNQLRELVDEQEPMSIRDQCGLLGLSRSAYYYECRPESAENLELRPRNFFSVKAANIRLRVGSLVPC